MSINAWGSDDPAEVAKGGTGAASLTDGGILLGSGTSPVTPTAQPTDGQLLIGNSGSDPALAVPSGTSDEIAITGGSGTLTVGLADDPILPGSASVTIPAGATGSEPSAVNGMMRYDSTTDKLRAVINGSWVDVSAGSGGGGGLVYLSTATISAATTEVVFDNTTITSAYDTYLFQFANVNATSGSRVLAMRVSTDNGSSYVSSSTYYDSRLYVTTSSTVTAGDTQTSYLYLVYPVQNPVDGAAWGSFWLFNPLSTTFSTSGMWTLGGARATAPGLYYASFTMSTAYATDALKFYPTASTLDSGLIHAYGLTTS